MGWFSRMKKGVKSKANAAIDKMVDPEKELDKAIMELEEQRKQAIEELISYKATAKQMEQDIEPGQADGSQPLPSSARDHRPAAEQGRHVGADLEPDAA